MLYYNITVINVISRLKESFNLKACRRTLMAIGIKEIPCLLLTFGGAAIGLSFLNHNPAIELGMALAISFGSEYVAENYLFKKDKCCDVHPNEKKIFGLTPRSFLFALTIGVATWWAHGVLLHDDDKNHVQNHIEREHQHAEHDHGHEIKRADAKPQTRHPHYTL